MNPILPGLALATLLLTLVLLSSLWRLRHRLAGLQQRFETAPTLPASSPRPVIGIRILNPFELAVRETRMAGPVAKLAPQIIERIVYKRTVEILVEQLRERGVEAQVETHSGGRHVA